MIENDDKPKGAEAGELAAMREELQQLKKAHEALKREFETLKVKLRAGGHQFRGH